MDHIDVFDRVQIIKVGPESQGALNKFGQVIMVADGTTCVVQLDDGGIATADVSELKKVSGRRG